VDSTRELFLPNFEFLGALPQTPGYLPTENEYDVGLIFCLKNILAEGIRDLKVFSMFYHGLKIEKSCL